MFSFRQIARNRWRITLWTGDASPLLNPQGQIFLDHHLWVRWSADTCIVFVQLKNVNSSCPKISILAIYPINPRRLFPTIYSVGRYQRVRDPIDPCRPNGHVIHLIERVFHSMMFLLYMKFLCMMRCVMPTVRRTVRGHTPMRHLLRLPFHRFTPPKSSPRSIRRVPPRRNCTLIVWAARCIHLCRQAATRPVEYRTGRCELKHRESIRVSMKQRRQRRQRCRRTSPTTIHGLHLWLSFTHPMKRPIKTVQENLIFTQRTIIRTSSPRNHRLHPRRIRLYRSVVRRTSKRKSTRTGQQSFLTTNIIELFHSLMSRCRIPQPFTPRCSPPISFLPVIRRTNRPRRDTCVLRGRGQRPYPSQWPTHLRVAPTQSPSPPFRAPTATLLSNGTTIPSRTVLRPTTIAFQCSPSATATSTVTTASTSNASSSMANNTMTNSQGTTVNPSSMMTTSSSANRPPAAPPRFASSAAAVAAAHSRYAVPPNRTYPHSPLVTSTIKYAFTHPSTDAALTSTATPQNSSSISKPPPTAYPRSRSANVLSNRRSVTSAGILMDNHSNGTASNPMTNLYSTAKRNPNVRQNYGSYYMHRVLLPTTINWKENCKFLFFRSFSFSLLVLSKE